MNNLGSPMNIGTPSNLGSYNDLLKSHAEIYDEFADQSSLQMHYIETDVAGILSDREMLKDISLCIFQRPRFYLLWNEPFYQTIQSYCPAIRNHDMQDNSTYIWRSRCKKLRKNGWQYERRWATAKGISEKGHVKKTPTSVAATNAHMSAHINVGVQQYKALYLQELDKTRRMWKLEEEIDADVQEDQFLIAPFVALVIAEEDRLFKTQLECLDKVFGGLNVQFIIVQDDSYIDTLDYSPREDNSHEKHLTNSTEIALSLARGFVRKNRKQYKQEVLQRKSVETIQKIADKWCALFKEDIVQHHLYCTESERLSKEDIQYAYRFVVNSINLIWQRTLRTQIKSPAELRKSYKDWKQQRDEEDAEWKQEYIKDVYEQDNTPLHENSDADDYSARVNRGFGKCADVRSWQRFSEEKKQEVVAQRNSMRQRRSKNREEFASYHREYNVLKATTMGTWEKDNNKLSRSQKYWWKRHREIIKEMQQASNTEMDALWSVVKDNKLKKMDVQEIVKKKECVEEIMFVWHSIMEKNFNRGDRDGKY